MPATSAHPERTVQPARRFALWKWLLGAGGLFTLLLLIALGIALWPRWQEWRLVNYIRAQGGEVEYGQQMVTNVVGDTECDVIVGISLPDDAIRRIDLSRLAKIKSVSTVSISGSHVEPQYLEGLSGFVSLDYVAISDSFLYGDCCLPLARLPRLEAVSITGCRFEDETTLRSLAACRSLTQALLSDSKLTDRGARELAKAMALTTVDLNRTSVSDEALKSLSKLPQLSSLQLDESQITDDGISLLQHCTSLKELSARATPVNGKCLASLSQLPNLSVLILDNTGLTKEAVLDVKNLQHLTMLSLVGLSLDDIVTPALLKLTKLSYLDLDGNAITDSAAAELAKLPALAYLGLEGTKVTAAGIEKLRAEHPLLSISSPEFAAEASPTAYPVPAGSP